MDLRFADKTAVRRLLSARRNALSENDRAAIGATVLSRLLALPVWKNAPMICGYLSTRGELDTLPLWEAAVTAGKSYALPVTLSGVNEGRMVFRAARDFCPDRLARGRFGILEPPENGHFPIVPLAALQDALVVVPGLGFDREGFRIGYGGGYYDRFFDSLIAAGVSAHTVGLCPGVCRIERLPREAHDRPVDIVLDETVPVDFMPRA